MQAIYIDPIQIQVLIRILIAMFLGALIGLDREAQNKPAGLRTHILVSGAAALLITDGGLIVEEFTRQFGSQSIVANPNRIIAAIITGISFLGAGTIIRDRSERDVKGLTTAASLLFASVVGMSVALSKWLIAFGASLLVLIVLRFLPWVESRYLS